MVIHFNKHGRKKTKLIFFWFLKGSLFSHYTEQQVAQVPTGLQHQILQFASMPAIQTTHVPSVVSQPVPIQPKPTPKPIAPATMNPSIIQHKQSFQSKVWIKFERTLYCYLCLGESKYISCSKCWRINSTCYSSTTKTKAKLVIWFCLIVNWVRFVFSWNSLWSQREFISKCFSEISRRWKTSVTWNSC